ncbi:HD domain-containing protein [Candidatus Woesearchaeota archaeon]|nr:HD domain-containing protein [Candidatus Woesearchaeota archaeon]
MKNTDNITDFFFETGQLKRVKRSGFWLLGIKDPESVAEHSFRAAIIGHVLAEMESADCSRAAMMCLFNDLHEARLNDLHKVGHRYIDFRKAETEAHKEQTSGLGTIGKSIFSMHEEFQAQKTKESIIARDADLLENAVQAREYLVMGYKDAQNWIENIRKLLRTSSAKKLFKQIEKADPNSWWKGLKKIER